MKRLDGIKEWMGDKEGAVMAVISHLLGRNKHYSGISCSISAEVFDKNGKLLKKWERLSDTFVDNAAACLMTAFAMACDAAPGFSAVNVAGAAKTVAYSDQDGAGDYCVVSGIADDTFGVLVGTSATAYAWTQYNLQGKISHGAAAGLLAHGVTTRSYVADSGAPAKCTIQRSFDNNSGAEITVREIGWFLKSTVAAAAEYWMLARDTITPTTVPNGGRLTVTYNVLINPT